MARSSTDSWHTAGLRPASFISRPASTASLTPRSLSGTSVQPVKRFSRFQVLSPCRSNTSLPTALAMTVDLRRDLDDMRELVGVEARSADQDPVAEWELNVRLHVVRLHASAVQDP